MKRVWLISILLFALTALPAFAQDDLTNTFTSSDGVFSFQYPDGWQFGQTKSTEAVGLTADRSVTAVVDYPSFEPNGKVLTPVAYLNQTIIDLGKDKLTDAKVTPIQIGGRDAARLNAKSSAFGTLLSLTIAFPEHLAAFAFIGTDDAIHEQEATLFAIATSFTLPTRPAVSAKASGKPARNATGELALTRTFTLSDGTYSIKYPDGWDTLETGFGAAAIYDGNDVSFTFAYPVGDATTETPRTVLAGLFADGKFTDLDINGHRATRIENFKAMKNAVALLVDFDGNYAQFLWTGVPEKVKQDEATLMAMIATFTVAADADRALIETFTVPGGLFTFRYPHGWTIDIRDIGVLHFGDTDNAVQGTIRFDNDGKTARETVENYMDLAGVSKDVVQEVKIGTHTGARTSADNGGFTACFFAVDLDGGSVMLLSANGPTPAFEDEQLLIWAMMASAQVGSASTVSTAGASTEPGALTESYVAPDKSFSFNYPDNWQLTPTADGLNFDSADHALTGVVEYGETSTPARQLIIDLLGKAGVTANPTSYEARNGTVFANETRNGDIVVDIFAIDFGDHVFVLSALGNPATIDQVRDQLAEVAASFREDDHAPIMAFARTGEIAPDSALTETYTDNPAFSFRYPTGWTIEVLEGEARLDLTSDDQTVGATIQFGQFGKSARDYIIGKAAQLGQSESVVHTFDLNGRSAAEATIPDSGGASAGHFIAVDYGDGYLLTLAATGLMRAFDKSNPLLLGIMASFQPADAAAAEISATAEATAATVAPPACTVTAASGVNLRAGPGTTFAIAGSLAAGVTRTVIAQDTGADGKAWWQLDDGNWLRSDLVTPGGDCASIPTAA